jgi:hypothetical protein
MKMLLSALFILIIHSHITPDDFLLLEQSPCSTVHRFIKDLTEESVPRITQYQANYEQLCEPHVNTNLHINKIFKILTEQSTLLSTLIADVTTAVMATPDCWTLNARKVLGNVVVQFGDIQRKSITVVTWHGLTFNVLGETLEKDVPHYAKDLMFGQIVTEQLGKVAEIFDNAVAYAINSNDLAEGAFDRLSPHERVNSYHHNAGMFDSLEALKRTTFDSWVLDKGLAAGVLREIVSDDFVTVGDFGAGGGHYSRWFNETGLVHAFAFDGTPEIEDITGGRVTYLDLSKTQSLNRTFDWVFSIEVAEHVPQEFEEVLLDNWARHAKQGLIVSWSAQELGIGHVNPQPIDRTIDFIQKSTGMVFDKAATDKLRSACTKNYIANTASVFRRV